MNRLWIREKLVKYSKITVWVDVSGRPNDIVADVGMRFIGCRLFFII